MEQKTLNKQQKKAIKLIAQTKELGDFYLSGGTALAGYHLCHRLSDDLDFFNFKDFDPIFIHAFAEKIKKELPAKSVKFSHIYDRYQFFYKTGKKELKIEFTKYPFRQLEKPNFADGIKIDSLRDIAANKLAAILDRFDPKDFVDIYFILKTKSFSLKKIKTDVEKKFLMEIEPLFLGSELSKVSRIKVLPKMIKPLSIKELKNFISEEIKKLKDDIIKSR